MRSSLTKFVCAISIAAVVCLACVWVLQSRAPDSWGYGKLAVTNGTPRSAVYYLEVRGISWHQPTIARVVRFADQSAAPANALEVSHGIP